MRRRSGPVRHGSLDARHRPRQDADHRIRRRSHTHRAGRPRAQGSAIRHLLPLLLALAWAAAPARADEVAAAEVGFVDAVPRGPSVAERLAEISRRIQAALVYPPLARIQHIQGETLVRFEIEHDGTARDVLVHRSSGSPSLDRAATRAVAAAAPLPWVYGLLEVPVRFELKERR